MSEAWTWITEHWEFVVGTLIGVLGLVTGVWALFQRRPERLDYDFRSKLVLIHQGARKLDQLKVTYGGEPIVDPRVVVVRVRNTGKRAVTEDDFKGGEPITIRYEQNAYTSAELTDASPGLDLRQFALVERLPDAGGVAEAGPIAITPLLLNPGEWFDVQLISDGRPGEISVTSRFAEQSRQMQSEERRRRMFTKVIAWALAAVMVAMVSLLIYVFTLIAQDTNTDTTAEVATLPGFLVLAVVLTAASIVLSSALIRRTVKVRYRT